MSISQDDEDQESKGNNQVGSGLSYFTGAIDTVDVQRFQKVVFRTTKGNNWTYISDIIHEDGDSKDGTKKSVFIVVYSGGQQNFIKYKLNRICDSFNAAK